MRDAKSGAVLGPQRLKMNGETNLAASVHLRRLAVKLRQFKLRSSGRIRHRDIKLQVEFILEEIVHVPALAFPFGAVRVGRNTEPIAVFSFIHLHVLDQCHELLLPPLCP